MSLSTTLAKELVKPLATLLARSAFGSVTGTVVGGLLNIAEKVVKDYYDQKELVRNLERIAEKVVKRLEPRFREAIDEGGVDVDKVAAVLGSVLDREASAEALLQYHMQPDQLVAAWQAANPDRWNDFNSDERRLYDAALTDAARYLVDIAPMLPRFQGQFSARVVQQLQSVSEDLDTVLNKVDEIEQLVRGKGLDDERTRFEANYRRAVLRRFDYMELLGADIPREARRHPLSVAYVSISLLAADEADDQEEDGGGISQPFEAILDQLEGRRLLIRGEAGSGKSTLLRWSALQAADLSNQPESSDEDQLQVSGGALGWRDCVPFLIRLRDYPEGRLPGVFDMPAEVAKNVGAPPEHWVRDLFERGAALLLFDGVDEVPNARREEVRQEIENIVQAYPGNIYLVSTRPAAAAPNWMDGSGFQEASINRMSASDRSIFVQRWHDAVREQLRRDKQLSEEDDFDALAKSLTGKMADNAAIAHLATNPLLCGMICALHRERQDELPQTQGKLCEDLCEVLLERRERQGGLETVRLFAVYGELNYEQKRGVIQELAHYMVRNGQSSVTVEDADRCFVEALSRFGGGLAGGASELRQGFVERSGVLREPEPDRIDFIHNTIKEYLAGDRFAQLGDTGALVEHSLDPAWQPAITFAAGSRVVGFADRLIECLVEEGGVLRKVIGWRSPSENERARKMFAVRCGGAALHLSEENRNRLNQILKEASRPETTAESEAFAALGDFVVPYLGYKKDLPAKTAVACLRTLNIIGSDTARACIDGYEADRRKSVLAEFRQATDFVNSIGMRMRLVAAGEFEMGSNDSVPNERPVHHVRVSEPFLLAIFPVTQDEYQRVMKGNPSSFEGDGQRPVEQVSWLDAVKFCNRLSSSFALFSTYPARVAR